MKGGEDVLDNTSLNLLKIYDSRHTLSCNQLGAILDADPVEVAQYVIELRNKGFLRIEPNYAISKSLDKDSLFGINAPLQITLDGKAELDMAQKISHEKKVEWIRYWITTSIAVAAFIKSFFFPG